MISENYLKALSESYGYSRLSKSLADRSCLPRSVAVSSLASSSRGGDSMVGVREFILDFFRLPNGIPQLPAKLASVLVAVAVDSDLPGICEICSGLFKASGDGLGTWYDVVRLRFKKLSTPSDTDSSRGGVTGKPNGLPSLEGEEDNNVWSANAVVGGALDPPGKELPSAGIRPENFEVVDNREAREPGRRGDT